ncbi:winged helix-turn-helix domain-containing protein [Thermococcus alcaliphilus]|uniref:winged helix-turn-helix domain-containing protein n=1 Tax=Thermococcus alcaliphilus TaxID=139207 RepID=UPI0020911A34|nr:winged helix-turn-helix domain-containing protein [Thermococcus alcaliphilus]MCO6042201.1 winged helix-turn-helix domain-containing protein [Thermococcus alcaliphilus]
MKEVLIVTDPEKIKLLGDRTRLEIVNLLRERPMSVSELSVMLKKSPSTIYRHINLLEKAGFVEEVGRDGNETLYRRSARIFLIAPYQEGEITTPTMKAIHRQEAETLYNLFKNAGFEIDDKKIFIEVLERFLTTTERLSRDLIKRLEGFDLNPIEFIHLMNLLVLINSPKLQEEAKELRKLLKLED